MIDSSEQYNPIIVEISTPFTNLNLQFIDVKDLNEQVQVSVKDVLGKKVDFSYLEMTKEKIVLDASKLPKGIYFVELTSENSNLIFETKKIVKY